MENTKTMTLLNSTGDITISWNNEDEAQVKALIQSKIDQGFVFFVLEDRPSYLSIIGKKKVYIKDVKQLNKHHKVTLKTKECSEKIEAEYKNFNIEDKEVDDLFRQGSVAISRVTSTSYETVKRAKNVDEIMSNHTIAHNRLVGG